MVRGVNRIILVGNLASDPELRYTPQGTPVATFRLAVNRSARASDGSFKEEVMFVTVTASRQTAELCTQYLNKGRPVLVEGRLNLRSYEKEGEKRQATEVVASRVVFLGGAGGGGAGGGAGGARPPAETAEDVPDDVPFY